MKPTRRLIIRKIRIRKKVAHWSAAGALLSIFIIAPAVAFADLPFWSIGWMAPAFAFVAITAEQRAGDAWEALGAARIKGP